MRFPSLLGRKTASR